MKSNKNISCNFERTPETISLNSQLRIVDLKGFCFNTPKGLCRYSYGYALEIPGKGFIRFNHDSLGVPYSPRGGEKALQRILDCGGFIDYDSLSFVQPLNRPVA